MGHRLVKYIRKFALMGLRPAKNPPFLVVGASEADTYHQKKYR
jgi:hypothetical protein